MYAYKSRGEKRKGGKIVGGGLNLDERQEPREDCRHEGLAPRGLLD